MTDAVIVVLWALTGLLWVLALLIGGIATSNWITVWKEYVIAVERIKVIRAQREVTELNKTFDASSLPPHEV
jgi:hypothetical protein